MYNSVTEQLIKAIPLFNGVNTERLPQILSEIYAIIIGARTQVETGCLQFQEKEIDEARFFLDKIHLGLDSLFIQDCYKDKQKEIAYVSATAYTMRCMLDNTYPTGYVGLDSLSPGINATLLYIIADSISDASEFITHIQKCDGIEGDLLEAIECLVKGNILFLSNREYKMPSIQEHDLETNTKNLIIYHLLLGIRDIALLLLGLEAEQSVDQFNLILKLSVENVYFSGKHLENFQEDIFYGIWRLSKYLIIAKEHLLSHAVINIENNNKSNRDVWKSFLKKRVEVNKPYLWNNHLNAINQGVLNNGISSVCTYLTGAGKSTLAELKIAAAIANGKEVIYLVPTHALEFQVKKNLSQLGILISPLNLYLGGEITSLSVENETMVHVVTPERCLTLINENQLNSEKIGLIVFDEFHLISSFDTSENMRNITAMMCLLILMDKFSSSDFFLISAMVKNGKEISEWLETVTKRKCLILDEEWKPTRQLEGCLIYNSSEINDLEKQIRLRSKNIKRRLLATPYCLFCLKNVWDTRDIQDYKRIQLLNNKVNLNINASFNLTGNTNEVSTQIAISFLNAGYKVMVFTNNISYTSSIQKKIGSHINKRKVKAFFEKNEFLLEQIKNEVGNELGTYIPSEDAICVVHHGLLLPEERYITEKLYTLEDGVNMIVATPTLAQGINLPADIVLISGDLRFNLEANTMENLQAHEILNAAGRAGRAGFKSYGISILIPSQPISMDFEKNRIDERWMNIQDNIFANGDHCLEITDPIDNLISSIIDKGEPISIEELVFIHRLDHNLDHTKLLLGKTFAAYKSTQLNNYESFTDRINQLISIKEHQQNVKESEYNELSSALGVKTDVLEKIGEWVDYNLQEIVKRNDAVHVVTEFFNFLDKNPDLIVTLLSNNSAYRILFKCHSCAESGSSISNFTQKFVLKYLNGENFENIDSLMPNQKRRSPTFNRVRRLVIQVIPSISYMYGIVYRIIKMKLDANSITMPNNISCLASLIKEGVPCAEMLDFKIKNKLMRVTCHKKFTLN